MPDRAFIDTNVFVYLNTDTEPDKIEKAKAVINRYDCVVSTQVANELCNVLTKKFSRKPAEIDEIISVMESVCNVVHLTLETTKKALDIHDKYGYSFYDALILSAALDYNCKYVFSEDLHDGQIIESKLTIINPFK
jgi:predicted nucleic acid-binding protein